MPDIEVFLLSVGRASSGSPWPFQTLTTWTTEQRNLPLIPVQNNDTLTGDLLTKISLCFDFSTKLSASKHFCMIIIYI